MSGHALAKCPVTIYRNSRSRWAEIRIQSLLLDTDFGLSYFFDVFGALLGPALMGLSDGLIRFIL